MFQLPSVFLHNFEIMTKPVSKSVTFMIFLSENVDFALAVEYTCISGRVPTYHYRKTFGLVPKESEKMRSTKRSGGFIICLLFNCVLNLDGLIPAAILLALHFIFDISYLWSVGAALIWLAVIVVKMLFFRWVNTCSNEIDKPKKNKNPYSAKSLNEYYTKKE